MGRLTSTSTRRSARGGGGAASAYDAFISYSHGADAEFAPSLQRGLRKLAKPWNKRSALRVFLDKTSLSASPDLESDLDGPISRAKFFILLASTQAASPESYVGKEVDYWRDNQEMDRLLIAKTDGEIHWDAAANDFDWEKTTALPRSLAGAFPSEPNYVDFSDWQSEVQIGEDPAFREAIARLAAPIHGKSMEDLVGEDLDQQRRTRRLVRAAVSALVVLFLLASTSAVIACQQRNVAVQAKNEAVRERNRALVALFQGLRLNVGADQNAGSLCFEAGSRCVPGREIAAVEGPPGTPIPLGTLDADRWLGTVNAANEADPSAGGPASNVFVVASQLGEGRVIGYAHDGLIRDAAFRNCALRDDFAQCAQTITTTQSADNLTFVDNALRWSMRPTPAGCPTQRITVAIYEGYEDFSETQEIAGLARRRDWSYEPIRPTGDARDLASQLRCVNALIWGNPWDDIGDPLLAAVVAYVRDGGGLLLGGLGWSWMGYSQKPMEDYPANRLAAAFGFGFTRDAFEGGVELRLRPPPAP